MPISVYPYKKFRFKVEIDEMEAFSCAEVSGTDASIDVIEYREGDFNILTPIKLPGLVKYSNITFKWGMIDSVEMHDWLTTISDGTSETPRRTVTITLLNETGSPASSWQLTNAWPCKYTGPDFNASASDVAFESIELAHEGMRRISVAG